MNVTCHELSASINDAVIRKKNEAIALIDACRSVGFSWAVCNFYGIGDPPGKIASWDEYDSSFNSLYIFESTASLVCWLNGVEDIYDILLVGSKIRIDSNYINKFINMHRVLLDGESKFSCRYSSLCGLCDIYIECIDGYIWEMVDCKNIFDPQKLPENIRAHLVKVK